MLDFVVLSTCSVGWIKLVANSFCIVLKSEKSIFVGSIVEILIFASGFWSFKQRLFVEIYNYFYTVFLKFGWGGAFFSKLNYCCDCWFDGNIFWILLKSLKSIFFASYCLKSCGCGKMRGFSILVAFVLNRFCMVLKQSNFVSFT